MGSHQNAYLSKDGTNQYNNGRLPKDSPLLCYPFDLKRQVVVDPTFSGISTYLEVIPISQIVSPNIPSLLPKDLASMRLQSMNTLNNYLTTALCSIASQEELVYSILGTDAISEEGFYRLTVEDMGERCEIKVGPHMLAVRNGNTYLPYVTNTNGNDVWAYILEQAYALKFGLLSSILEGEAHEVIYAFLDGEYKVYDVGPDKYEAILKFLKVQFRTDEKDKKDPNSNQEANEYMELNFNENKKIITVTKQGSKGVRDRHTFIITDFKTVKTPADKVRYVRLAIIDDSDRELARICTRPWSSDEMNTLDKTQLSNGQFWFPYDDLLKNFNTMVINSYRLLNLKPDYNKSVLKLGLDGDHSCALITFDVTVPEDKFIIGVHQKHKNYFKTLYPDYKYANLRLVLIRLEEKTDLNWDVLGTEGRESLGKLQYKKIFIGKFENSSDSKHNDIADIFSKPRLKAGRYLLALEVFWKVDYFKNINISISGEMNTKVDMKLISSGSNFDVVFYKTFVSYYMNVYEAEISGERTTGSRSLKTKDLDIVIPIRAELTQNFAKNASIKKQETIGMAGVAIGNAGGTSMVNQGQELTTNTLELMEGFHIIYCIFTPTQTNLSCKVCLTVNPQFICPEYIISPELLSLLDGQILDLDKIELDIEHPMIFFLIRRNLNLPLKHPSPKFEKFFSGYALKSFGSGKSGQMVSMELIPTEQERQRMFLQKISNLYFELLFFDTVLEVTVPCIRKPDREILQSLARSVLKELGDSPKDATRRALIQHQYGLEAADSEVMNHSDQSVSFLEMDQETMTQLVKRFGKKNPRSWQGKQDVVIEHILHCESFLGIYVENKSTDLVYTEQRKFTCNNLLAPEPDKDLGVAVPENTDRPSSAPKMFVVEYSLQPGKHKLTVLNLTEGKSTYRYKYDLKFKLSSK